MKVHLKPYVNWFGPYQFVDKLFFFLNEETREKIGDKIPNKPFQVIHDLKKKLFHTDKIRIDDYDTWSMDSTLAPIILPMLKQLKATKHGIPSDFIHDQDIDMSDHSYYGTSDMFPETLEEFRGISIRNWDAVMDKMIWSFQTLVDDENKPGYWEPYWVVMTEEEIQQEIIDHPNCALRQMMGDERPQYKVDRIEQAEFYRKQQEGFELFGKYYRSLWT